MEIEFVKSVPSLGLLPPPDLPEFAFIGRSNVGKSSLVNAVAGAKIAKVSNTPGRTQMLNFFHAGADLMLVDLPGYGFAKASKAAVTEWTALVKSYLRGRPNLARVFVLIDSRRGIGALDRDFMKMLDEAAAAYTVVLTKADKEKPAAVHAVRQAVEEELKSHAAACPEAIVTSAEKRSGIDAVWRARGVADSSRFAQAGA